MLNIKSRIEEAIALYQEAQKLAPEIDVCSTFGDRTGKINQQKPAATSPWVGKWEREGEFGSMETDVGNPLLLSRGHDI